MNGGATASRLDVFLLAGETSGDVLGAGLMRALARRHGGAASFRGVGGPRMTEAGLASLYPAHELTSIGFVPLIARLPNLVRRFRQTVAAIVAAPPDVVILIDVPDFSLRVARAVRRRLPDVPIVKYVSPTVWVWRSGRARAMRRSIDRILAVFPFEPEVHRRLGGPPCVYVGHPLLAQLGELRPSPEEERGRGETPLVLALPGSRRQEIRRLGPVFGSALEQVSKQQGPFEVVLPTLPQLADEITAVTAQWAIRPRIVVSEADKHAAFRRAKAALAASGTVTLELALSGIPHVAAYRISLVEGMIARMVLDVPSVILANLVLGELVVPEFLQTQCTAANLARALADVLDDTPARQRQQDAFRRLDTILGSGDAVPSERAAGAVLDLLAERRQRGYPP
ncbi:MAG TPA: lipid-A-disaccharide synthase [Xanthobacteraceae bacterium]|nr:lipid-A-disaccharide synthase [Xanthobacteraceae bacterium]